MEVLENITANIEEFDSVEISVSAEILITTSEDVAGNEEVRLTSHSLPGIDYFMYCFLLKSLTSP